LGENIEFKCNTTKEQRDERMNPFITKTSSDNKIKTNNVNYYHKIIDDHITEKGKWVP
jgi:hypothetical protein